MKARKNILNKNWNQEDLFIFLLNRPLKVILQLMAHSKYIIKIELLHTKNFQFYSNSK